MCWLIPLITGILTALLTCQFCRCKAAHNYGARLNELKAENARLILNLQNAETRLNTQSATSTLVGSSAAGSAGAVHEYQSQVFDDSMENLLKIEQDAKASIAAHSLDKEDMAPAESHELSQLKDDIKRYVADKDDHGSATTLAASTAATALVATDIAKSQFLSSVVGDDATAVSKDAQAIAKEHAKKSEEQAAYAQQAKAKLACADKSSSTSQGADTSSSKGASSQIDASAESNNSDGNNTASQVSSANSSSEGTASSDQTSGTSAHFAVEQPSALSKAGGSNDSSSASGSATGSSARNTASGSAERANQPSSQSRSEASASSLGLSSSDSASSDAETSGKPSSSDSSSASKNDASNASKSGVKSENNAGKANTSEKTSKSGTERTSSNEGSNAGQSGAKQAGFLTVDQFDKKEARAALGKTVKFDDLTLIEGIGPKIAGLFKDAGIATWRQLSETAVTRCHQILDDAGPRYRMHSPDTWPDQAKLAAKGEWKALAKLQDELDGGRKS